MTEEIRATETGLAALPRIHALPKQVSDKIAAGEVVDRPLSIVKELVENAIDAGASSITIEIRNGGKSYIRVTDDGCGIARDQVLLAFQRHATSKIQDASDLDHINTLGFRGEALASIAAVSHVELITKPVAEKAGVKLRLQGGEMVEQVDTGCPDGTTIIVTSLFYNTPARLKFLKGDNTESSLIIDFVSKMALAYSKLRIRMVNNGNILFNTPGSGQLYQNILTIYSKETGQKLLPISVDSGSMFLEGYISDPSYSKTNRKSQIFFVNGRYIQSRLMEKAVAMAYSDKLFEGRYPVIYLFLYVKADTLDVNIHPNKREVRFDDELAVLDFVHTTLRDRLNTKQAIPEIRAEKLFQKEEKKQEVKEQQQLTLTHLQEGKKVAENAAPKVEVSPEQAKTEPLPVKTQSTESDERPIPAEIKQEKAPEVDIRSLLKTMRQQAQEQQPLQHQEERPLQRQEQVADDDQVHLREQEAAYGNVAATDKPPAPKFDFASLQVSGTLFHTYIMASDGQFFYLIDQHAAHERVFYEQLLAEYEREEKHSQLLLLPIVKEVTPAVRSLSDQWLDCLTGFGFEVEEFGAKSYVIKSIPLMMEQSEAADFLDYFFDNIEEGFRAKDRKRIDKIIMRSCKQAVKANDSLTIEEIQSLLSQLSQTENPFSCPHGRPTFIKFSKHEIEKMFQRV